MKTAALFDVGGVSVLVTGAASGILVNGIAPGPTITGIGGGRLRNAAARLPFEQVNPSGRLATPDDVMGPRCSSLHRPRPTSPARRS